MFKTLLCALVISAMGTVAANAATLKFVLKDKYAYWDNAFKLVETSTDTTVAKAKQYSMSGYKTNVYKIDLDPGHYKFTLYDFYDGYIKYAAVYLDGALLGKCEGYCLDKYGKKKYKGHLKFKVSEVPLPASALLLLGGLAGLGVMRRKKA